MTAKDIIKSQSIRHLMLKLFAWLPDRVMLPLQYWLTLHRKLNMKNPQRFTEKIQCYKAFYRNNEMLRCVDKFLVRDYVIDKLGTDKYLNKLYQVCDKAEDIDWESLPNKFVIKTTDGGNGDNVFICRNKSIIDKQAIVKKINSWKGKKLYSISREWAYVGASSSKIIVERYLSESDGADLRDYKFFCFNGKPYYCQLIQDRSSNETIDFYDMDWNHMPFYGLNPMHGPAAKPAAKPAAYESMKEIAKKLSAEFPFVRVDLYSVEDGVYFGELTFYPASGYGVFTPDEWDYKLGELIPNNSIL